MINSPHPELDCACDANTCRCTSPARDPDARPSPSLTLELTGALTASAQNVHQMLTRSAFAGPLLDAYDKSLRSRNPDRGLIAHQAAALRQLAAQKLRGQSLDTSLTPHPLTASQALGAITTDPASAVPLRLYNEAMRTGNVVQASKLARLLRFRAASVWADVQAHERSDAMAALEARVYATNPSAGDWARLRRRANKTNGKASS